MLIGDSFLCSGMIVVALFVLLLLNVDGCCDDLSPATDFMTTISLLSADALLLLEIKLSLFLLLPAVDPHQHQNN